MSKRLWILGASDPEMTAIEALLTEAGESYAYAISDSGERVHPGNAYRATGAMMADGTIVEPGLTVPADTAVVIPVECEILRNLRGLMQCAKCGGQRDYTIDGSDWAVVSDRIDPDHWDRGHQRWESRADLHHWMRVDHHRLGDPGYGRPPEEFLAASSIGQVVSLLAVGGLCTKWPGWTRVRGTPAGHIHEGRVPDGRWLVATGVIAKEIPREIVLTAAADHCLGAAYRGECPGVDPDELMQWRVESRATFQGRAVADVMADIERAREVLRSAPSLYLMEPETGARRRARESGYPDWMMAAVTVRDMRRDTPIPELPEAATRDGIGYVSGPLIGPDGRQKFTCSGSPEQIRAFMDTWAPAQGLTDIYGDPARGFAGGYR